MASIILHNPASSIAMRRFSHEQTSKYGWFSHNLQSSRIFSHEQTYNILQWQYPTIIDDLPWFFPALSHDFQERDSSGATPLWLAAKGTKCPASELQSDLAAEPAGEVSDPSPRSQNKFGKSMKIHGFPKILTWWVNSTWNCKRLWDGMSVCQGMNLN